MRHSICLSAFLCCFLGAAACKAGEPTVSPVNPNAASQPFEDRAVPSTYQYDNGPAPYGIGNASTDCVGVHRYDAIGGADYITAISCAWVEQPNGTAGKVWLWQDDGSGNPANATLLFKKDVTIQNTNTGIFNVYTLPQPVLVKGSFFVGFSARSNANFNPISLQQNPTPPYVPGRAFFGYSTSPDVFVYRDMSTIIPGYFLVRASGTGSSFTYQGKLATGGGTYTGNADMIFQIFDRAADGTAISPSFSMENIAVSGGIFSLSIPTDAAWFAGSPDRFIEIQVRTPAGSGSYEKLTPRHRITQVPMAMAATFAQSAVSAQSAETAGNASTANYATNAGNATTSTTSASTPWSGVTGIPAAVSSPIKAFDMAFSPTSTQAWSGAPQMSITATQKSFDFQAGIAVVNWNVTGWCGGGTKFVFRFRIGNSVGPPTSFYFNQSDVHMTISGTAVLAVPAGVQMADILIQRPSGPHTFVMDGNDSVTYSIVNIRQ